MTPLPIPVAAEGHRFLANEPDWLLSFVKLPGVKLTRAQIDRAKEKTAESNEPWTSYLWSLMTTIGQDPMSLVGHMAAHYRLPVFNIQGFSVKDLTPYLPLTYCERYWMVPYALSGSLLSIGVVDPSVIGEFQDARHAAFSAGLKAEQLPFWPTVPQYSVISPITFKTYSGQIRKLSQVASL